MDKETWCLQNYSQMVQEKCIYDYTQKKEGMDDKRGEWNVDWRNWV